MANQALSPRVLRLASDISIVNEERRLSAPKLKAWVKELQKVPVGERVACSAELLALAANFDQDPKAKVAAAQLYLCAATLLKKNAVAKIGWGTKKK